MTDPAAPVCHRIPCTGPGTRSQQHHCPEGIEHQYENRRVYDGARRAAAHALSPTPGPESYHTSDECDREPEARAFQQSEPDVLEQIEKLQALDEIGRGEVEQRETGQPARDDADCDRESHDDG